MDKIADFIVIGSGFGGSVSALRLAEKGYRVLVLEQGRRYREEDFPHTNTDLPRWLWAPSLGFRGPFRMTFLPHLTALSGVGVGGGSLVYANTLPVPKSGFFKSESWSHLADWERELLPHYATARKMLGAVTNSMFGDADKAMEACARHLGRFADYGPTEVGVYFGRPGETAPDPYFGGKGPSRTGCIGCGGCMLGCRFNAKNTLDKNYLYLAEGEGVRIQPETRVTFVGPEGDGYRVTALHQGRQEHYLAGGVVFAAGVLGTMSLLLELKERSDGLPNISDRLGHYVRTNSEALVGVVTRRKDLDMSKGIAIGSMLQTDEHSHAEPVRYSEGSDFFRLMAAPLVDGRTIPQRLFNTLRAAAANPRELLSVYRPGFARSTLIMLYMRSLEGSLRLKLGRGPRTLFQRGLTTVLEQEPHPTCNIPEAEELARALAREVDGFPVTLLTETLLGIPTTAHILGGCSMGRHPGEGVIDAEHRLFGYPGIYIVDGSAVSANPGVNPSLTICALAERAMAHVPAPSVQAKSATTIR